MGKEGLLRKNLKRNKNNNRLYTNGNNPNARLWMEYEATQK